VDQPDDEISRPAAAGARCHHVVLIAAAILPVDLRQPGAGDDGFGGVNG